MSLGQIVLAILGGGLLMGAASLVTARTLAYKTKAETDIAEGKAPVERDSIAVQGAEQAVLTMQRSMEAAEKRAEKAESRISTLEREREEDRATIERLQAQLREVSLQAEHAEQAAAAAREQATALQNQLDEMQRSFQRRSNGS
jgi:chromosome segregation ATPase